MGGGNPIYFFIVIYYLFVIEERGLFHIRSEEEKIAKEFTKDWSGHHQIVNLPQKKCLKSDVSNVDINTGFTRP